MRFIFADDFTDGGAHHELLISSNDGDKVLVEVELRLDRGNRVSLCHQLKRAEVAELHEMLGQWLASKEPEG